MDTVLRRERLIISGCLAAVVVLSWLYLVHTKAAMPGMDMPGMVMVDFQRWGPITVLLLFVMWTVMMAAMMLPSATLMILAFVTVNQRRQAANRPFAPAPADPTTKKCPECKMEIPIDARRCAHCTSQMAAQAA